MKWTVVSCIYLLLTFYNKICSKILIPIKFSTSSVINISDALPVSSHAEVQWRQSKMSEDCVFLCLPMSLSRRSPQSWKRQRKVTEDNFQICLPVSSKIFICLQDTGDFGRHWKIEHFLKNCLKTSGDVSSCLKIEKARSGKLKLLSTIVD